jgi:phosphomannomutase
MTVEDIARSRGVPFHRVPVGEVNVALKMREVGAVIGGEGNGGVMFPGLHVARDGLCGMALILQCMLEKGTPLGRIIDSYPGYCIDKRKIPVREGVAGALLQALAEGVEEANRDDGLRIAGEGFWVHLRASNTEPVMRIITEARSSEEAKGLAHQYEKKIIELLGSLDY